MKLKQIKCLSCGSPIKYESRSDRQKCDSCNNIFFLEEEKVPDNIYLFSREFPLDQQAEVISDVDSLLIDLWQLIALIDVKDEQTHLSKYNALETILKIRKKLFNT